MSASLVTKDSTTVVDISQSLHLAVRPSIARAGVYAKRSADRTGTVYEVKYWNLSEHRLRSKIFCTQDKAEAFRKSVFISETDRHRIVRVAEILADARFPYHYYRLAVRVEVYPTQEVPVDPMLLGLWIGDGTSRAMQIATADTEIVDYMRKIASQYEGMHVYHGHNYNYVMSMSEKGTRSSGTQIADPVMVEAALSDLDAGMGINVVAETHGTSPATLRKYQELVRTGKLDEYRASCAQNPIVLALKDLGVWHNKHIPEVYLKNSRECRLAVLAGIIDTDGYLHGGGYDMVFASKKLIDDVVALSRSLGFRCADARHCKKACTNSPGGPKLFDAYRTRICGGSDLMDIPVLLERRKIREKIRSGGEIPFKLTSRASADSTNVTPS
jgi:hypothetical protein